MPALDRPLTLESLLDRLERLESTVEQQGRELRNLRREVRGGGRDLRDEPAYVTQMVPQRADYATRPAKRQRLEEPRFVEPAPVVRTIVQPMAQPVMMPQPVVQMAPMPMPMGGPMGGGMSQHATQLREPSPGEAQIHIQVEGNFVRDLIGAKGANVNRIQRDTGAHIHFERLPRDQWHLPTICTLTGRQSALVDAVKQLAGSSAELSQSRDHKVVLCVPDQHYGFVVGKRGANIKRLKEQHENVRIDLKVKNRTNNHNEGFDLGLGTPMALCAIYGPPDSVAGAIGDVISDLHKAQTDRRLSFQGRLGPGGDRRGSGGGGFQQPMMVQPAMPMPMPMGGGQIVYAPAPDQGFSYAQRGPPRRGGRY